MSHKFARRKQPTKKGQKHNVSFAAIIDIDVTKLVDDIDARRAMRWLVSNLQVTDEGYEKAPIDLDFGRKNGPVHVRICEYFN